VELDGRQAAVEARGLRLVPLRELAHRPEAIYRLNQALERDLPSDVPIAQPYDVWRTHALEMPLFSPDASFCVLAADEPVAMTWIVLDEAGHRARHGMTGTLPAFRHQGLARLVKLASIRWLAEHGVTRLFTDNDTENRDMLALNEHLGFRPLTVFALWSRPGPDEVVA
jgi:GNAT superfamily N-acetyltransferase